MIRATWGETLAPTVAALIVERPPLGRRLALAPRRVLYALAAFVSHASEQGATTADIARDMDTYDVRELLRRAIPAAHPRLYGLLDRMGVQARPLRNYERTNHILCGPASDLLLGSEAIDDGCLQVVGELVSDRVLLAAQKVIGRSDSNLRQLRSVLSYLRATGLSLDVEQLPHGAGWHSIKRRITADLGRAIAPLPPFRCPAGWRYVATLSDLFDLGRQFGNCVNGLGGGGTHHLVNFVLIMEVFFANNGEPTALASVQNVGPCLWVIAETAFRRHQPGRSPLMGDLRVTLGEVLAEAGHVLLEITPVSALQSVAWNAESNTALGEGDDDIDAAA